MIGKTLGHYSVSALLGKGGMGEVYQAKDTTLGRDVAIKVLPEEFAKDHGRLEHRLWTRQLGTIYKDHGLMLEADSSGNVYVVGGINQEGLFSF